MKFRISVLIGIFLGHSLGWLLLDPIATASSLPAQILISELQTNAGTGHSNSEFIELYNPTDIDATLSGWKIQYHSSSNSDCINGWSSSPKILLPTPSTIKSHGFYLIAATGYLSIADLRFTAGLSDSAGAIRVVRPDMTVSDGLAWGSASCGTGVAAPAPTNGRSLERRPGEDLPLAGNSINTNDNFTDFSLRTIPEPQSIASPMKDPVVMLPITTVVAPVYLPLKVTELLIDPVSPAIDSHDEFIELQNPNLEPINISGYTLKTPTSTFHLLPAILAPGQYTVVSSTDSTISLSNNGGNLQVFDPSGTLVDESAPWPKAIPGASWASFPDGWAWTNKPTRAASNIFEELPLAASPSPANPQPNTTDQNQIAYLPLQITELYVDPISPQTDSQNEFVELFNPNDEPIDTSGYIVKSGLNLGNTSTLAHHIIEAHEYLALYSRETNLPLSNSGSILQLYDPIGTAIGANVSYGPAKAGQVWMLAADGTWQWSTTSTPNYLNILTLPIVAVKTIPEAKAPAVSKSPIPPKAKVTVAAKPKVAKLKKSDSPKPKSTKSSSQTAPAPAAFHKTSGHTLILILLGLTICYVIYEFRYDIRHTYFRLRGHTKPRA